jgi:hypothetical protein
MLRSKLFPVLDQGFLSLCTFLPMAWAASTFSSSLFGQLAVILAVIYTCQALSRALAGEVLQLHGSSSSMKRDVAASQSVAVCAASVCALLVSAWCVIWGIAGSMTVGVALLALVLILFDHRRSASTALGDAFGKVRASALMLGLEVALFVVLGLSGASRETWLLLCWAAAGLFGTLVGHRVSLRVTSPIPWLRRTKKYSTSYVLDAVAHSIIPQSYIIVLAVASSAAAAGGFRASLLLLTPLSTASQAASQVLFTALRESDQRLRFAVKYQLAVSALTCANVLVVLALPQRTVEKVVGASTAGAIEALPGLALYLAAGASAASLAGLLRLQHRAGRVLLARWVISIATIALILLAASTGLASIAWAMGAGSAALLIILWAMVLPDRSSCPVSMTIPTPLRPD